MFAAPTRSLMRRRKKANEHYVDKGNEPLPPPEEWHEGHPHEYGGDPFQPPQKTEKCYLCERWPAPPGRLCERCRLLAVISQEWAPVPSNPVEVIDHAIGVATHIADIPEPAEVISRFEGEYFVAAQNAAVVASHLHQTWRTVIDQVDAAASGETPDCGVVDNDLQELMGHMLGPGVDIWFPGALAGAMLEALDGQPPPGLGDLLRRVLPDWFMNFLKAPDHDFAQRTHNLGPAPNVPAGDGKSFWLAWECTQCGLHVVGNEYFDHSGEACADEACAVCGVPQQIHAVASRLGSQAAEAVFGV
jgi:hypothetical protein